MRQTLARLAILCLAPLAILNCGGESFAKKTPEQAPSKPGEAIQLTLTSSATSLTAGQSAPLGAVATDVAGNTVTPLPALTWTSSAPTVASVTQQGLVTGVGSGTTTITARAGTLVASATVSGNGRPGGAEVLAELPRIYLNTSAPPAPAAGHSVLSVSGDGNLQAALKAAKPGDVIELEPGATFVGNFVLPDKKTSSTDWITIRPANYSKLPPEGTRMTPAIAGQLNLPRLQSPNSSNTIATAPGAHHYRIIGLDVGVVPTTMQNYGLVAFDGGERQTTVEVIPHDLVLDRSYVHGTAVVVLRRCVLLNSASSAVIDSWLSDCHDDGSDSQAIVGYNGPGPYKIVNNYLEAAGENIMFGGADPAVPNLVPSDIEIRRNHLFKPLAWQKKWLVKNHFELKNAQRVLFEGNVLENNWSHGQNGTSVAIKSVNQGGRCTWCVSQDVTVRLNFIRNVGAGFNIAASPDNNHQTIHARRITITDNVITNINQGQFYGEGRGFSAYGDLQDVVIAHNTMMGATNSTFNFGPSNEHLVRFTARDNILHGGQYGVIGDNFAGGGAIQHYAPDGTFRGNVIVMVNGGGGYPQGNLFPKNAAALGFMSMSREDFRLSKTSDYRGRSTDGRDPGADVDALTAAIHGVKLPGGTN